MGSLLLFIASVDCRVSPGPGVLTLGELECYLRAGSLF